MTTIAYHASHEQFSPAYLLQMAQMAEQAGFQMVFSSDHSAPWSHTQDEAGFTWAWLGAAMQTTTLPFGVVTAPGYRYHPAVLAQAVATLHNMFPGRLTLALGSGEALNEHMTGIDWPEKPVRNQILHESAQVMRQLWNGERVTFHGAVHVNEAQLYSLPKAAIPIYGAALTPNTAQWLGGWADGLITTTGPLGELRERIAAFKAGGGEHKPLILKAQLSYDTTYESALAAAYNQWRFTLLPPQQLGELHTVHDFEVAAANISPAAVAEQVKIATDFHDIISWIHDLLAFEPAVLILHNVNTNQRQFITDFGQHVLPQISGS